MTAYLKLCTLSAFILLVNYIAVAQINTSCPSFTLRNNSNGGANSCPGVSGNPIAPNVIGTPYATVPSTAKTGNIRVALPSGVSNPYVITKVYQGTTLLTVLVGPPGPKDATTSEVAYCFYDNGTGSGNLPSSGTVTFLFRNPQNPNDYFLCSYDFSNGNVQVTPPAVVLPVKFLSFAATIVRQKVQLQWQTSMEINTSHFIIEQSTDGNAWNAIGSVPAAGFSSTVQAYSYTDPAGRTGENFYRIREVDLDGSITYSEVRRVFCTGTRTISASTQAGSLVISNTGFATEVQVVSATGQVMVRQLITPGQTMINIATWNKGIYFLKTREGVTRLAVL
ncbi:MAG TPA: T9SS type A sorting domain-containing protein [Flavisolibacter sp.]